MLEMKELSEVSDYESWLPEAEVQLACDPLWLCQELSLPLTLALSLFAIDFLSLMGPGCFSFMGRALAATAWSTGLLSKLEAIEAANLSACWVGVKWMERTNLVGLDRWMSWHGS